MYLEVCPVYGNHSVNVITIMTPPSPFGSVLLGSSHLQTVSLDLTLQGRTFCQTRQLQAVCLWPLWTGWKSVVMDL